MTNENLGSKEERAKRVRYIRERVLDLTREQFSAMSGIHISTLINWELVRNNGLSEKGVHRLLGAFRDAGVVCPEEWLLYGRGEEPVSPQIGVGLNVNQSRASREEETIRQELQFFHQLNPNSTDMLISDMHMLPCFWLGDYVAGKIHSGEDIKNTVGLPCIVQMPDGIKLLRLIDLGDKAGFYDLLSSNSAMPKNVIKNAEIISAAPIIWLRRRLFNKNY